MDVGNDLSASYGALLLGFVLCTVFWSFLLVQTCVSHPSLISSEVLILLDRVYYQIQSVNCTNIP
jgi:hypothetical protein